MLTTIGDAPAARKTSLLREVEEFGHAIALAKAAIATLRMDDITGHGIPFARDELEAIVDHTARATQAILESCETLDEVAGTLSGGPAEKLQAATTRIYEACSFQHVTGQRIATAVTTLKTIETQVARIISTFGTASAKAGRGNGTGKNRLKGGNKNKRQS
jgi:chemotaxis protein CheZ